MEIREHSPLVLVGRSGIGKTSFFHYLMSCYASGRRGKMPLSHLVPVFVPLTRYQGMTPQEMLDSQLKSYGRISDKELTDWFLQQGGFLFFFDGLNEVDNPTRSLINSFVDQYRDSSYFCLSSQQNFEEYKWMNTAELAALNPGKVREVLRRHLDEAIASKTIAELTADMYRLYAIPQNLKLAIKLVAEGSRLPQSRRELYAASLAPIFRNWIEAGQADFPEMLTKRAYEMLCARDPFFDQAANPVPVDLSDRLVKEKVLIRRGERLLFQHDLIRGYLASQHFVASASEFIGHRRKGSFAWDKILSDAKLRVDSNWRTMLEFTILEVSTPAGTKSLIFSLTTKNRQLAADLFKWAREFHPNLVIGWEDDFNFIYGRASLET